MRTHPLARGVQAAMGLVMLLLALSVAAPAHAETRCTYFAAPANLMTVTVSGQWEGVISRRGSRIVAGDYATGPQPCTGGTPTVSNTDTIEVLLSGSDLAYVEVLLANGPLAPGASVEREGASEIELQVSGRGLAVDVVGTTRDDDFRWAAAGPQPGLNLNPSEGGDEDVDISIIDDGHAPILYALGAAGNDTITGDASTTRGLVHAQGGPGDDVLSAPPGIAGAILSGGPGDDVITGSRFHDVLLGDAGSDRILGRAGADTITGGTGRDRIWGGAGRDFIDTRDRARDIVRCGIGRDRARTDRRDRLHRCESPGRR